jgi:lipopolysaccharide biosynthesis glycosyltransferase
MKWYFAISQASLDRADHDWQGLIRVAIASARANTTLVPHMLYDGEESDFTRELRRAGVVIINHRVSFYGAVEAFSGAESWHTRIAAGAFLRIEIPDVEHDDEFVLYTDVDVQFLREIDLSGHRPALFAAAPQSSLGDYNDLNSGVMLINVPAMAKELPDFKAFIANNLQIGLDQEMLAAYFPGRYDVLAPEYNWKPYWGRNDETRIVHWHGPKPILARRRVDNPDYVSGVHAWDALLSRDVAGYSYYLKLWTEMNDALVNVP